MNYRIEKGEIKIPVTEFNRLNDEFEKLEARSTELDAREKELEVTAKDSFIVLEEESRSRPLTFFERSTVYKPASEKAFEMKRAMEKEITEIKGIQAFALMKMTVKEFRRARKNQFRYIRSLGE